jgi:hypothetical protein
VTPQRLHGLWYSSALPLFFILSAMGAGLMVVVLLKILYAWSYDPEPVFGPIPVQASCPIEAPSAAKPPAPARGPEMGMLRSLATIAAWVLGLYFVLKVAELLFSGDWTLLLAGTWESWLFAFELLLGAALPILLLALPRTRSSPVGVGLAAFSATAGLVLNRLDVGIFGYFRDAKQVYLPSLAEWALGIGVVAAAGLVFLAVVENFAVFDTMWQERRRSRGIFRPAFDSLSGVWSAALSQGLSRVTIIAVLAIPLGWVTMYPPFNAEEAARPVRPSSGVDATRSVLCVDGDRSGLRTLFPHEDHRERLGGEAGCVTCHHIALPGDHATPCSRCHQDMVQPTNIFDHFAHMELVADDEELRGLHPANHSCSLCHAEELPESADTARSCLECHEEDMWRSDPPSGRAQLALATGFVEAMHGTCVPCHEEEAVLQDRPDLAECTSCHASLGESLPIAADE